MLKDGPWVLVVVFFLLVYGGGVFGICLREVDGVGRAWLNTESLGASDCARLFLLRRV